MRRALTLSLFLASCSTARGTVLELRRDAGALSDGGREDGATPPDVDGATPDGADGSVQEPVGTCRTGHDLGFLDQFDGAALNAAHWLVARGNVAIAGEASAGGFSPDNVRLEEGKLVLTVRGDDYTGPVRGFDANGAARADGKRTGAAIATRDLFMSGTYQWEGRISGPAGLKVALVVRRNDEADGFIALRAPGLDGAAPSYAFAEARAEGPGLPSLTQQIGVPTALDDGNNHSLRFDWHAGAAMGSQPSFVAWADGDNLQTLEGTAPRRAARAWLVAFVPGDVPAPFDSAEIRIETAFITTFDEANDACADGELTQGILVAP